MVRATTPTIICTFDSELIDLSTVYNIYVTIAQGYTKITKTGEDLELENNSVGVYLTQAETLKFKPGDLSIQVNWTYPDGGRGASVIAQRRISDNLLNEVVE